jgi:hypothetical protein
MSLDSIVPSSTRRRILIGWAALLCALTLALTGCATERGGARTSSRSGPTTAAPTAAASQAKTAKVAVPRSPHSSAMSPRPCAGNAAGQLVLVSLRLQHLWMCAGHHLAYSTPITSGMSGPDTATPTGTYRIQGLNRDSVLTLASGATFRVKYWIPFDAPLFGFHDSSWQKIPYGDDAYRTRGSHGCVHLPLTAIKVLYDWADIGTAVRIRA